MVSLLTLVTAAFWPGVFGYFVFKACRILSQAHTAYVQGNLAKHITVEQVVRIKALEEKLADLEARIRTDSAFRALSPGKR